MDAEKRSLKAIPGGLNGRRRPRAQKREKHSKRSKELENAEFAETVRETFRRITPEQGEELLRTAQAIYDAAPVKLPIRCWICGIPQNKAAGHLTCRIRRLAIQVASRAKD